MRTVSIERGYVRVAAGDVCFHAAGEGSPTVFLLHETPLASAGFRPTLERLGLQRRVVAFDTPGYGDSTPLRGTASIEAYADVLVTAIAALGAVRFVLAGIHTGAAIALEIARRATPGPGARSEVTSAGVAGLVLSGVPLLAPEQRAAMLALVRGRRGRTDDDAVLAGWHDRARRWYRAPRELLLRAYADELHVFDRRDVALEAIAAYDAESALRACRVPLLLLNGRHDSLAGADERAAALRPDATLRILEDFGGQLQWAAADHYCEHLAAFADAELAL